MGAAARRCGHLRLSMLIGGSSSPFHYFATTEASATSRTGGSGPSSSMDFDVADGAEPSESSASSNSTTAVVMNGAEAEIHSLTSSGGSEVGASSAIQTSSVTEAAPPTASSSNFRGSMANGGRNRRRGGGKNDGATSTPTSSATVLERITGGAAKELETGETRDAASDVMKPSQDDNENAHRPPRTQANILTPEDESVLETRAGSTAEQEKSAVATATTATKTEQQLHTDTRHKEERVEQGEKKQAEKSATGTGSTTEATKKVATAADPAPGPAPASNDNKATEEKATEAEENVLKNAGTKDSVLCADIEDFHLRESDEDDVGEVIIDDEDDEDAHPKRMTAKNIDAIHKFFEKVHDEILVQMKAEGVKIQKKMAKNGQGRNEIKQMHKNGQMRTPSKSKLSVVVRDAINDMWCQGASKTRHKKAGFAKAIAQKAVAYLKKKTQSQPGAEHVKEKAGMKDEEKGFCGCSSFLQAVLPEDEESACECEGLAFIELAHEEHRGEMPGTMKGGCTADDPHAQQICAVGQTVTSVGVSFQCMTMPFTCAAASAINSSGGSSGGAAAAPVAAPAGSMQCC